MPNPLPHPLRRFSPLLLAATFCISGGAALAQDVAITPIPASVQVASAQVQIGPDASIVVSPGDAAALSAARWLADEAAADRGLKLSITETGQGAIRFERVDDPTLGAEGYRLDVSATGARIQATTDAGLFYGAVSLLQLLTPEDGATGAVTLKGLHVEDRPRFPWRGLMLDSARHYQSVAFIEALLDQMARYKLNTFHWHLTDDQAWRIEIKRYPRLTRIGAWRVEAGEAHQKDIDPNTGKPRLYGGFYTQAEVRQVVAYAKARNITVVPEIEMPGHASAAILAYPVLGLRPVDPKALSDWGVFPNLYAPTDSTFAFLQNILTEVMDLFPGPYIHVGGDEAIKDYWKTSTEVQAQIKALGLKDEDALQSWFIQRIERFLAAHGRRLVGWDEILAGGLAPGAVVMSWHGVSGAVAAANLGHDAILTPGLPFYFDNRQSSAADEPPGRGLIISLRNVYGFDPTPTSMTDAAKAHILGLQANVWTEHIRLDDRVEHMAFPRAVALAEMAWSPPEKRSWDSFIARLPTAIRRDEALGLQPALSAFEVRRTSTLDPSGAGAEVTLSTEAGLGDIRYTLDGSAPTPASPAYTIALHVRLPTTLRAAAFQNGVALSPATDDRLDALTLRHRDNHEMQVCSDKLTLNLEDDGPVNSDHRAVIMTDTLNPCWIWKGADLSGIKGIAADVANLPFDYEGISPTGMVMPPPTTPDGELNVRLDGCEGPLLAALPLAPAIRNTALTTLRGAILATAGKHDLCFVFTRAKLDPMWLMDAIQLEPGSPP
jgi:hexosaminidase